MELLDARLQAASKQLLDARGIGSVVVLDPKTGAVLAMASNPGFDPSILAFNPAADRASENARIQDYWTRINADDAGQPLLNRPTQSRYPPGSTFKTVTAVGVLNHPEVGKPEDISCPNELFPQQDVSIPVVNAVDDENGYISQRYGPDFGLDGVYAFSCNTAFAQYGLRLQSDNRDMLVDQAERFHIYAPENLPDEGDLTDLPSQPGRLYSGEDGAQWWSPTMICWGLGAFGLGLTGLLETNTKEDMGAHARLVILWGANLASQPNTAPHLLAARRRGAYVVTIDVRRTEAAAQSDEVVVIRPGTDAALALALMHVIIGEGLVDRAFVAEHTVGFDTLAAHVRAFRGDERRHAAEPRGRAAVIGRALFEPPRQTPDARGLRLDVGEAGPPEQRAVAEDPHAHGAAFFRPSPTRKTSELTLRVPSGRITRTSS